jgi:hypothetical protein
MILLKVQGMHTVDVFLIQQKFNEKILTSGESALLKGKQSSHVKDILNSKLLIPLFLILKLC